ncbi:MAG: hypothetical protein GC159_03975 [Phycisphaera sp.]|nr:hypothetical protein [Phycisphaera sp.]
MAMHELKDVAQVLEVTRRCHADMPAGAHRARLADTIIDMALALKAMVRHDERVGRHVDYAALPPHVAPPSPPSDSHIAPGLPGETAQPPRDSTHATRAPHTTDRADAPHEGADADAAVDLGHPASSNPHPAPGAEHPASAGATPSPPSNESRADRRRRLRDENRAARRAERAPARHASGRAAGAAPPVL